MPKYVFHESYIWEAGDPVDLDNGRRFKTKARSLERVKLPLNSSVGRNWVLISVDGEPVKGVNYR